MLLRAIHRSWIAIITAIFVAVCLLVPGVQAADTSPAIVAAEVTNKGDVSITFDQAIANPAGTQGQFLVTVEENEVNVTAVETTNTEGKIKLILETKASADQVVSITYTKASEEALQLKTSEGSIALENFTYQIGDAASDPTEEPVEEPIEDPTEELEAPALVADTTDNTIGNVIEITFDSNVEWSDKITNVDVDEIAIEDKYTVADGVITIEAGIFTVAKDYAVVVKATGYQDAAITQTILAAVDEEEETQLTDIAGHWAQANIEQLVAAEAISGYPDGTFAPDKSISRAEFATVLVKAFQLEAQAGKEFADTAQHWAKDAIATANAHGIVGGYDDSTFAPDDSITREQMAVMIVKAAKLAEDEAVEEAEVDLFFADKDKISAWALDSVAAAYSNQLISGYPDNTFRPDQGASRAEAVTVIMGALSKVVQPVI